MESEMFIDVEFAPLSFVGNTISIHSFSGNFFIASDGQRCGFFRILSKTSMYIARNPVLPMPVHRMASVSTLSSNLQIPSI
jgi:hypothetical protein